MTIETRIEPAPEGWTPKHPIEVMANALGCGMAFDDDGVAEKVHIKQALTFDDASLVVRSTLDPENARAFAAKLLAYADRVEAGEKVQE